MKMRKYKFINIIALLLILASCKEQSKEEKMVFNDNKLPITIIKKGEISSSIQLPGEIKPFQEVEIYSKVNGFVREVLVDRGSKVKKGDKIAILDAPELEAQFAEALSKLHAAESVLLEKQTLYKTSAVTYKRILATSKTPGTVAANDLDISASKMKMDSMQMIAALENVSSAKSYSQSIAEIKNYLILRAPFDGIITERNVHPGALVGPNNKNSEKPLFKLEDENTLRLVVAIPEYYTSARLIHTSISFTVKTLPGDTFTVPVSRTTGSINAGIRSEVIEADIFNANQKLKSGIYADVILKIQRGANALIVPKNALVQSTEHLFVIRIVRGKAKWIDVKKGYETDTSIEIFGHLSEGDTILSKGNEEIRDGAVIRM